MIHTMGSIYWLYTQEKRHIYENKLYLSDQQKQKLLKKMKWWLQPENSIYDYDLYFNNCSTIVRDILAETFGPEFKKYFINKKAKTFRQAYAPTSTNTLFHCWLKSL